MSNQALEQRFGPQSARLLPQLWEEAVGQVLSSQAQAPDLLSRFNGVSLHDGTVISLPASLASEWSGCGGSSEQAGRSSVRLQARLDLARGGLQGPWFQEGRASELSEPAVRTLLPARAVSLVDMGYFTLPQMRRQGQAGCYGLSPATAALVSVDRRGQCWDLLSLVRAQLGDVVDLDGYAGKQDRLPVRLIARRVAPEQAKQRRERANQEVERHGKGCQRRGRRPASRAQGRTKRQRSRKRKKVSVRRLHLAQWTILLTNVPRAQLSVEEALGLARWSFQIERLWKLWKQYDKLDSWSSEKP